MCPYIDKYLDVFNQTGINYEVILWNRENIEVQYPPNYNVYNMPSDIYGAKWKKIKGFLRFRNYIRKTIKEKSMIN